MRKTMITAHSGCDGTLDNSREFLDYALSCAADAVEIDIRPDGKGSYCLSHDAPGGECLALGTAFDILKTGDKLINCDLKQPGMELGVLGLAREFGIENRILLSGTVSLDLLRENREISKRTLLNIKPAAPELQERFKWERRLHREELRHLAQIGKACGALALNIPFELCTEENLDIFKSEGVNISAWTVNDEEMAGYLLKKEIFNITTRNVKALCIK